MIDVSTAITILTLSSIVVVSSLVDHKLVDGVGIIIPPVGEHKFTVIFSHGLGGNPKDLVPLSKDIIRAAGDVEERKFLKNHVKWIFTKAPLKPSTINGGKIMPSWFDIFSLAPINKNEVEKKNEDRNGIEKSAKMIHDIAIRENKESGIPLDRIVFMGFSQGAVISLYAGITFSKFFPNSSHSSTNPNPNNPGVVALSGWLSHGNDFVSRVSENVSEGALQPNLGHHSYHVYIFQGHGTADQIVPIELAKFTRDALSAISKNPEKYITFRKYKGISHTISKDEIDDIANWMLVRFNFQYNKEL